MKLLFNDAQGVHLPEALTTIDGELNVTIKRMAHCNLKIIFRGDCTHIQLPIGPQGLLKTSAEILVGGVLKKSWAREIIE